MTLEILLDLWCLKVFHVSVLRTGIVSQCKTLPKQEIMQIRTKSWITACKLFY